MRFTADAHPGLADGTITVTFRRWTRPQVKVGGRYTAGEATLLVDAVSQVKVGDISEADARRSGAADRAAAIKRLGKGSGGRYGKTAKVEIDDDTVVWRVDFHRVAGDPGPKLSDQADLGPDEVAEITRRLGRMDAASSHGPWTATTLQLIADHPAVVSTTLAEAVGRERFAFKTDVRKLKKLGLTESLEVGYRLSPRGEAYLKTLSGG